MILSGGACALGTVFAAASMFGYWVFGGGLAAVDDDYAMRKDIFLGSGLAGFVVGAGLYVAVSAGFNAVSGNDEVTPVPDKTLPSAERLCGLGNDEVIPIPDKTVSLLTGLNIMQL